jgi:predicted transcriptional regulator
MTTIKDLIRNDHKEIQTDQTTQKAISTLESSKDVAVVIEDGEYKGIITAEQIMRHNLNKDGQKVRSLYIHAPKLDPQADISRATRLLYENDLKVLPVVTDDKILGIIHVEDVLNYFADELEGSANEIMTTELATVKPTTTIGQTMATLRDNRVSRLPVVENGRAVGIVSIYDITHRVFKPKHRQQKGAIMAERKSALNADVQSIMQQPLTTLHAKASISDTIQAMHNDSVGSVIILEENQSLGGIITRRDVLEHIVGRLNGGEEEVHLNIASKIDDLPRQHILEDLAKFVEKYKQHIGPGYITFHIKQHKETLKGNHLLYGRLRTRCQKTTENLSAEGYGAQALTQNVLRKLRTRILKHHQDQHQISTTEYLDHFDITSL